jgi:hypothetical protein
VGLKFSGNVEFRAKGPTGVEIEDAYNVELTVPAAFPKQLASARETGGRIPPKFHHLDNGLLCLGSPTEVMLKQLKSPTIVGFIDDLVIPYLFGSSYFIAYGIMPFGELKHGVDGLLQQFASLFNAGNSQSALQYIRLAAMRKRFANAWQCPCGSGMRLGRCHNVMVNRIRKQLGYGFSSNSLG